MPSIKCSTTQPDERGQRKSLSLQAVQPTWGAYPSISSSPYDSLESTSLAALRIPDDPNARADLVNDLKGRIVRLQDRCMRWSQQYDEIRGRKHKMEADLRRSQHRLSQQQQRTQEVESQNERLVQEVGEAHTKVKQEQEKVEKLRLEYDRLQQDLSQHRSLVEEDDRITRRSLGTFNDLVAGFTENAIRDFNADIERACTHLRDTWNASVDNSDRCLRRDQELRSDFGEARAPECLQESQNHADIATRAKSLATQSPSGILLPRNIPIASRERKRSPDDTNDLPGKRIKPETAKYSRMHDRSGKQQGETGRSASNPNINMADRLEVTQQLTQDPRTQAVAWRRPAFVPQSTLRSL